MDKEPDQSAKELRRMMIGPFEMDIEPGLIPETKNDTKPVEELAKQLQKLQDTIGMPVLDAVDKVILRDRIEQLEYEISSRLTIDFFLDGTRESCANCLRPRLLGGRIIEIGKKMERTDWLATRVNMIGYIALCEREKPRTVPELAVCDEENCCMEMMDDLGCRFEELNQMSISAMDEKAGELLVVRKPDL